jgi:hypothetical protein
LETVLKPRLRLLLAAAFILIATVPLLILGYWIEKTALDKEIIAASEKHLLMVKNVSAELDRYALEVEATSDFFSESLNAEKDLSNAAKLGKRLDFGMSASSKKMAGLPNSLGSVNKLRNEFRILCWTRCALQAARN